MTNSKIRYYFFIEDLNQLILINLKKYKNYSLIYNQSDKDIFNQDHIIKIQKYCKKNSILFFLKDDWKNAYKYKANGIFISSKNRIVKRGKLEKKLKIIGSAHNQIEYYYKKRQGCEVIMLSPIFFNAKYSSNKILNINKFNLISNYWNTRICALGGITNYNLKKIKMTKSEAIASISLIKNTQKKNPPTILNCKWVF